MNKKAQIALLKNRIGYLNRRSDTLETKIYRIEKDSLVKLTGRVGYIDRDLVGLKDHVRYLEQVVSDYARKTTLGPTGDLGRTFVRDIKEISARLPEACQRIDVLEEQLKALCKALGLHFERLEAQPAELVAVKVKKA